MDDAWKRLGDGAHVILLGDGAPTVPRELAPRLLLVDCERSPGPLAPLTRVLRGVEQLLGEQPHSILDADLDSHRAALRRRLFREVDDPERGGVLVEALHRLRARVPELLGLALFDADAADPSTLELLAHVMARPHWLQLPVLVCFDARAPEDAGKAFVERLARCGVVVLAREARPTEATPRPLPELPDDVRRVLRAAAFAGSPIDVSLVSALLGAEPLDVLYALQSAIDRGVPLEDRGEGFFRMPTSIAEELNRGVTPSLARAWHSRLGQLLAGDRPLKTAAPPPDEPPQPAPRPAPHAVPTPETHAPERAAEHADRAGEPETAVQRYLTAAEQAERAGAPERGLEFAKRALGTLATMPHGAGRQLLTARVLTEIGVIQWGATGPSAHFSLQEALESLDQALALLPSDAPASVRAKLAASIAGVCYDIGDAPSLERALDELTRASQELMNAGAPREAAGLLNDQAAVWVRIGDPVRANHLLTRARELFRGLLPDDTARLELAETEHLLARLVLHVPARPDRGADALRLGVEYCQSAAEAYRDLERPRELSRVWDTLGRLEQASGHAERAAEFLGNAATIQQKLGDALGLADSTAALSAVYAEAGRHADALALLTDSVRLNTLKGSARGLGYNRDALDAFVLPDDAPDALRAALAKLRAEQERALGALAPDAPPD